MLHLRDNVALCPNHLCHILQFVATHLQLQIFLLFFQPVSAQATPILLILLPLPPRCCNCSQVPSRSATALFLITSHQGLLFTAWNSYQSPQNSFETHFLKWGMSELCVLVFPSVANKGTTVLIACSASQLDNTPSVHLPFQASSATLSSTVPKVLALQLSQVAALRDLKSKIPEWQPRALLLVGHKHLLS